MDGLIILNKPNGPTSFDMVRSLRKILHIKKIGHTGTLDPMATGCMVIAVGKATRLVNYIESDTKEYEVEMSFGTLTDTLDITGTVLDEKTPDFTLDDLKKAIIDQTGDIMQLPPIYSAIKVNGRHLYDYARKGEEVHIEARPITVYSIDLLEYDIPRSAKMYIKCSKGTYIRSIVRDIGEHLSCHAVMTKLRRSSCGKYNLSDSFDLETIEEMVENEDYSFIQGFNNVHLNDEIIYEMNDEEYEKVSHGNMIHNDTITDTHSHIALRYKGELCAVGSIVDDFIKCEKVFI